MIVSLGIAIKIFPDAALHLLEIRSGQHAELGIINFRTLCIGGIFEFRTGSICREAVLQI